jgi:hypothetical protein
VGLIPERQGTKLKQSVLLVLTAVFGIVADFLGFLWAEDMPVWERLVGSGGDGCADPDGIGLLSWCWT